MCDKRLKVSLIINKNSFTNFVFLKIRQKEKKKNISQINTKSNKYYLIKYLNIWKKSFKVVGLTFFFR